MHRFAAAAFVVVGLALVAGTARAQESAAEAPAVPVESAADADPLVPAVQETVAATGPVAQPLTGDELEALDKLAAERPELIEQAGGYVSNNDLVTILLVVLIVVIVL